MKLVKQYLQHIILLLLLWAGGMETYAQNVRYVECYSTHALSVPENLDYSFRWEMTWGAAHTPVNISDTTNYTRNIIFNHCNTEYHVSVYPMLWEEMCPGEPIYMKVVTVEHLSLFAGDDAFCVAEGETLDSTVARNDFDQNGHDLIYNPTLVEGPNNGTVSMTVWGDFTYIPNPGFTGVDSFYYEVHNAVDSPSDSAMYVTALAIITVVNNDNSADLYVEKTGPEKALMGGKIEYSIVVRNNGPDVAENVVLRDSIPFGLFNPVYVYNNQSAKDWEVSLSLGNMNVGDSANISIIADISPNVPTNTYIFNQALVYSTLCDADFSDNDSIWPTLIVPLYVDLPDQLMAPACSSIQLPNISDGNSKIVKYRWTPATGLDSDTIARPTFTPDETTAGQSWQYVLQVTDSLGNVASDTLTLIVAAQPVAIIEGGDTLYRDMDEILTIIGRNSIGDGLSYEWSSEGGNILGFATRDTVNVNATGLYRLRVEDSQDCDAYDSVWVLLRSHPPVAVDDEMYVVAGTNKVLPNNGADYLSLASNAVGQRNYLLAIEDTSINVLTNDSDINNFNLHVSQIVTPPQHSDLYWDSTGLVVVQPDANFWGVDSLEYRVCNDGIPVECSTAWLHIHSLRPPLNADIVIMKKCDVIAFWDDTIRYELSVYSVGPDTARSVTIEDQIDPSYFSLPQYRVSVDDGITWGNWSAWTSNVSITAPLFPLNREVRVQIKAYVDPTAQATGVVVENKAIVVTGIDINENDITNNADSCSTKLKEKVIARAGDDQTLGYCYREEGIIIDGSLSSGENLTYHWTPETYFVDPSVAQATFRPMGSVTGEVEVVLTITDDDNIVSRDTITVNMLPAPVADAGPDKALREDENVGLIGSGSTGNIEFYRWTNEDGTVISEGSWAAVNTVGYYYLTVTDIAGCSDVDTVLVYPFYYAPFAIPDYYSTTPNTKIIASDTDPVYRGVLYNDYDPNEFGLTVTPVSNQNTNRGGKVTINSNGSFTYTPPAGGGFVDAFTYQVCNGTPNGCSRGYVLITVNNQTKVSNLAIDKSATNPSGLIGKTDILFKLTITNYGPDDATSVTVTDSLSKYISNWKYSFDGVTFSNWSGATSIGNLAVGASRTIYVQGKLTSDAPGRIFNAATVSCPTFDPMFDWDDEVNRNVDTTSIEVVSDLLARAELVEQYDNNWNDDNIGLCDNTSYLRGDLSVVSDSIIEGYQWWPIQYLVSPNSANTKFKFSDDFAGDTTIVFNLIVQKGDRFSSASVPVKISPRVVADAGTDRKMNEGEPLILSASNSKGANLTYEWWDGDRDIASSTKLGTSVNLSIDSPGEYWLYVKDKHGCEDIATVNVTENGLFALNDIMVVIVNDTVTGNVATNDYDPNTGDLTVYASAPVAGPFHGTLINTGGRQISNTGEYTYRPNTGYIGDDYFTYRVCDDNDPDLCMTARVFIRVIDVDLTNSQPVANPDVFFVNKNSSLIGNAIANDYDYDGGIVSMNTTPVKQPNKGTLTINADGTFSYVPNTGAQAADSFYYRINDNGKPSRFDTAMVAVYIHKVANENHRPVAVDDAYYVVEKSITGSLLLNDYDPDGNSISMNISQYEYKTAYGTITFTDQYSGNFTYIPDPGFEGTDQFIYSIKDSRSTAYATAYFTSLSESRYHTDVAIEKTGPAEILSGDQISYTLTVSVLGPTLANDVVISDTLLSAYVPGSIYYSANGTDWLAWTGTYTFDQLLLYGQDSIYIRAQLIDTLSGRLSNVGWVDHDMVETKPDNNHSEWITQVYQRVLANAGDDAFIGACVTDYQLDGSKSLGMGTLKYSWTPVDDLKNPTQVRPVYTTTPGSTQTFILTVSSTVGRFTDSDKDTVTVTVAISPVSDPGDEYWDVTDPQVTLDGSKSYGDGPITYLWWYYDNDGSVVEIDSTVRITVNHSGKYYLTVTDTLGCSATDFTYVGYKIDPFIAVDDTIQTAQDDPVDIYVLRNDIVDDEDEIDISTMVISNDPAHGTVVWSAFDSAYVYTPEPYYVGCDTFSYIVTTKHTFSDEAVVVVCVTELPAIVPEGFSPNGDGINDVLRIKNIEKYPDNSLIIFNRWGSVVYQKEHYTNDEPWDGVANKGVRIGSGAVPAGVYLYILDLGDDRIKERVLRKNIYVASGK